MGRVGSEPQPDGPAPSPEDIRVQLERILASAAFAPAERCLKFLEFVVEETLAGRSGDIKEVLVAVAVFHKKTSFDPRSDSIVRVEARQLRARLRDYYATEGRDDPVIVDIPKGAYVPRFAHRAPIAGTTKTRRRWLLASAGALAAGAALYLGFQFQHGRPPENAVAVLPLWNLGGPESESLCQALTEDLTTGLARISALRVTARTSASRFQSNAVDIRSVARQLGVNAVLEGSLRPVGGRIHVTAQLIDAQTGYHIWSESYDRGAADLHASEAQVIRLIVAGVARALGVAVPADVGPRHVPSAEALDLFWRARYARRPADPDGWKKAGELLEQAVALDPKYTQAWSALASVQAARTFHSGAPFKELAEKTRWAAQKTLELDHRDPDAQLALARLDWLRDRNWPAAEVRFRNVVESNPNFAPGHGWFATALMSQGRFDEALDRLGRAVSLNPLSYLVSNDEATILYCARRYGQAIARARKTLQTDSRFLFAHVIIGACASAAGRYGDAIREFRAILSPMRDAVVGRLGHALARAGQRAEAEKLLRELDAETAGQSCVQAAFICTGLGDHPGALDRLERAALRHETDVNYIAVEPVFDPLRNEVRFLALQQKLGLR